MTIDITELLNHRISKLDFDYRFDPEHADCDLVDLPNDVSVPQDGIHVKGSVYDSIGQLVFSAHVSATFITNCARCLDEITDTVEFDIERTILSSQPAKTARDPHVSDDNEWDGMTDDIMYVNDARIIPDYEIVSELSLELPTLSLCSPDCPGLCAKCGKKLRDGDCGCREKKEINPKLAILQKLLENQE